jgi:hypothetical protein
MISLRCPSWAWYARRIDGIPSICEREYSEIINSLEKLLSWILDTSKMIRRWVIWITKSWDESEDLDFRWFSKSNRRTNFWKWSTKSCKFIIFQFDLFHNLRCRFLDRYTGAPCVAIDSGFRWSSKSNPGLKCPNSLTKIYNIDIFQLSFFHLLTLKF